MNEPLPSLSDLSASEALAVERACSKFEVAWKAQPGRPRPALADYLRDAPESVRGVLLVELLQLELAYRRQSGEAPVPDEYLASFPESRELLRAVFAERGAVALPAGTPTPPTDSYETRPHAGAPTRPSLPLDEAPVPGYEVLGELGRGGMGVVFKARHEKLNRVVALKMILAGGYASDSDLARFRTEAEALARFQHPNIVQVYDVGEHKGQPFFSMEFCAGGSLDKKLNGSPMSAREAAELVEVLARAMHAAHHRNIVHRDLKPANVLLLEDGMPKISDFGLAKKLDEQGMTASGAVMGTPSYMAPEQARGKGREVGPLADVYSLGAILYHLLTGRPPFKGENTMDTLVQVLTDDPVPPTQLQSKTPKELERICLKCLAKEPGKRYGSAAELADDLRRYREEQPIPVRPVGRVKGGLSWARRNPGVAVLLAVLVVFAAGATVRALFGPENRDPVERARENEDVGREKEPPGKADPKALADKALAILEANCHRCHGKDGSNEGGMNYVLDVEQLIARRKIVPGDPAKSRLFRRTAEGDMPPEDETPRPSTADRAVLKAWIESLGAVANVPPPKEIKEEKRAFVSLGDNLEAMRKHQGRTLPSARRYQRYFTFTHLHNNPAVSDRSLRLARAALAKLLNSLSWKAAIVVPQPIDSHSTVFVVDVRRLDWDRHDLWREVLKLYPYGLKHDRYPEDEAVNESARGLYKLAGTKLPAVRADWFLATASRPPLYHTLLRLPDNANDLERLLKVDVEANFRRNELVRAGFTASGVSRQNRLVERHEIGAWLGAYWKSYDFKNNDGRKNLVRFPLGPTFKDNAFERHAFEHDGGEIIFNLPNGLQGYLLVDAKDKRINEGPTDVVRDKTETAGSVAMVNGLSCMSCHQHGPIKDFKDIVRDGSALAGEARDKVRELYPKGDVMTKLLAEDEDRFVRALERATGLFLKVGPDRDKDIKDFPEAIGPQARSYLLKEVGADEAAYELGLRDATRLKTAIDANADLTGLGLAPLARGNTIKREVWESLAGLVSPFQTTAGELRVGTPYHER